MGRSVRISVARTGAMAFMKTASSAHRLRWRISPRISHVHSCLYQGSVRHRRRGPAAHAFRYELALLYLDLDEVDSVFAGRWLWSTGDRPAPVRWQRKDHYGDPQRDLRACVRELVRVQAGIEVLGPVRLLTHPRHFGYGFNPVSFY